MNRRHAIQQFALGTAGLAFSGSFLAALTSCEARKELAYTPLTLSAEQDSLLQILTEHIIPTTDTPGALAAGVHQYIDRVLTLVSDAPEKDAFLKKLDELLASGLSEKSADEQIAALKAMETSGEPFFWTLKSMTIYGYYTSEIGATQELVYAHATGYYDGDRPYAEVGRNYY